MSTTTSTDSTSSTSSSSSSSSIFLGTSRYSSDFQNLIDRAVAIASLPISQLNDDVELLESKSTALESLQGVFTTLRSAVDALNDAVGSSSLEATISDTGAVSTVITSGAAEGSYSIEIISVGSYTTAISSSSTPVTDPSKQSISTAASFTLTVDGKEYTINPTGNTLNELAKAINSSKASVQATVVNVGSSSEPDYRLSLQSTKLGDIDIQLNDGEGDLLTEQASGELASYKVNGVEPAVTSDSRSVKIATGVTLNLLDLSEDGKAVTVTITRSSTKLADALAALVDAFNTAVDEVDQYRGKSDGALVGDSIVYEASSTLRSLVNYNDSSGAGSLSTLGITLDETGHMTFSPLTFLGASFSDMTAITNFLGAETSGGFLQAAKNALDQLADPITGSIQGHLDGVEDSISSSNSRIDELQTRVDQMEKDLIEKMTAADALIAELEQQYEVLTQLLDATDAALATYSS